MRKILPLLLLLLLQTPPLAHSELNAPARALVLTHVTVIDATGAPGKPDMTVVIVGDRITEIGKTLDVRLPELRQVVDATGKFLNPGCGTCMFTGISRITFRCSSQTASRECG